MHRHPFRRELFRATVIFTTILQQFWIRAGASPKVNYIKNFSASFLGMVMEVQIKKSQQNVLGEFRVKIKQLFSQKFTTIYNNFTTILRYRVGVEVGVKKNHQL